MDAGGAVVARERVRQALEPLAQQVVDALRRQRVGEILRQRRVGARQDAVVGRLEGDAALGQLALDVLVAVDAQPRRVREVRAELHEHRPEVVVDQVEVVVVDHRRGGHQLDVVAAARLVDAALRAHHLGLLLRLADEQHALAAGEPAQMLAHALLLALPAAELHHLDPGPLGEALDPRHEVPRHRRHQRRRRHRLAAHLAEEPRRPAARLQDGHVGVEVHPVDAFEFQRRVLGENFRRGSCYVHGSDSGRWATHRPHYGHRRLDATRNRGFAPQRSSGRSPFNAGRRHQPLVGLRRSLAGVLEQDPSAQLNKVPARLWGLSPPVPKTARRSARATVAVSSVWGRAPLLVGFNKHRLRRLGRRGGEAARQRAPGWSDKPPAAPRVDSIYMQS